MVAVMTVAIACHSQAQALPLLQLDINRGTYEMDSDTIVAPDSVHSNLFTLISLYDTNRQVLGTQQYFISASIIPQTDGVDIGFFTINGMRFSAGDGNLKYGTPPLDELYGELAPHGVFPTVYGEYGFAFDPNQTTAPYNVENSPGGLSPGPGSLLYQTFNIDITGLNTGLILHFDLYDEVVKEIVRQKQSGATVTYEYDLLFAPFSHDAESRTVQVPDGGTTVILLGFGLFGTALVHRSVACRLPVMGA